MKRIFLTSALAISMIVPAMAETTTPDIAAGAESATCDSGTLNTTDGTSTLSAQWTANTINLKWYNGDVEYSTNTCIYDGGITLPASAPTRTGYNFAGWKVKTGPAMCTASSINNTDKTSKGTAYASKRLSGGNDSTYGGATAATYGISTPGEWGVTLAAGGTIKGMARCSTVGSGYSSRGQIATEEVTDNNGTGQYCWCQPTSYTPAGGEMCTVNSYPSWMFYFDYVNAVDCANNCDYNCANMVRDNSGFRSAVFGVSNN